jgi:hypothetical protein
MTVLDQVRALVTADAAKSRTEWAQIYRAHGVRDDELASEVRRWEQRDVERIEALVHLIARALTGAAVH